MLIPLSQMLSDAERGGYAVIAPDFSSLTVVRYLLETAEEYEAPLLLSYSPSLRAGRDLNSFSRYIELVREEAMASSISVGLHLDHANRLEDIKEAIDLGFTSVMIDMSQKSWEENVKVTQEVVRLAHSANVKVESELGHVAVAKQYFGITKEEDQIGVYTNPDNAVEFVTLTGVDALAVAIGTVHGDYVGDPILDFDLLAQLHQMLQVPLVLHGASGTGAENLQRAVKLGIRKINIYSDLINALRNGILPVLENPTSGPNEIQFAQQKAIKKVIGEYFTISGSVGRCQNNSINLAERARFLVENSYTFAEAIYITFAEKEGYTSDSVQKVCSMMANSDVYTVQNCRVLLGALAVIGLKESSINPNQVSQRLQARDLGERCKSWFFQRFGCTGCQDLATQAQSNNFQGTSTKKRTYTNATTYEVLVDTVHWLEENLEKK